MRFVSFGFAVWAIINFRKKRFVIRSLYVLFGRGHSVLCTVSDVFFYDYRLFLTRRSNGQDGTGQNKTGNILILDSGEHEAAHVSLVGLRGGGRRVGCWRGGGQRAIGLGRVQGRELVDCARQRVERGHGTEVEWDEQLVG